MIGSQLRIAALCLVFLAGTALAADDGGTGAQPTPERVFNQTAIPVYGYKVVRSYPHDPTAYTEGLEMQGGFMYEDTGLNGKSHLRQYDLATGRIIHDVPLDKKYFGEGITVLNGTIYQLTWLSNTGFTYDQATFTRKGSFRFLTQGWGLTNDGHRLLMSDGSSSILFLNPDTLEIEGHIYVADDVGPVGYLNELEYVKGKLYANVWQTPVIAIIDPKTGKIIGWVDLRGLNPDPQVLKDPYVLNGIAFNEATGRLLVTGKHWPAIYEIDLVPR